MNDEAITSESSYQFAVGCTRTEGGGFVPRSERVVNIVRFVDGYLYGKHGRKILANSFWPRECSLMWLNDHKGVLNIYVEKIDERVTRDAVVGAVIGWMNYNEVTWSLHVSKGFEPSELHALLIGMPDDVDTPHEVTTNTHEEFAKQC